MIEENASDMIGVVGGMGPAATVDFMNKLVSLTPASCDQEHLPVMIANLPHIPDRSTFLLGTGQDPLPWMLHSIDLLNQAGVGLVVIPCNTSHHWFDQMATHSKAPVLHIAHACIAGLPKTRSLRVSLFATRGAIRSGFYQRALERRGIEHTVPHAEGAQRHVDDCIRKVKGGDLAGGSAALALALEDAREQGVEAVIMGCTEIPVAATGLHMPGITLIDSTLELAREAARYALGRGWNRAPWLRPPTDAGSLPTPARAQAVEAGLETPTDPATRAG